MFSEPFAAVPVAHGLLFVPVGEHLRGIFIALLIYHLQTQY